MFNKLALLKLNELIGREKFVKISFVSSEVVRIDYEDRYCSITPKGKVIWYMD